MIIDTQGDLFDSRNKVIGQGCNCVGLMGAGVAKIVRDRHPIAFEKYKRAIEAGVYVPGYAQFVIDHENDRCIYNLATQNQPGADAQLNWIFLAVANMFSHAMANGISHIAIPRIGSGIGGLRWEEVNDQLWEAHDFMDFKGTLEVFYL